MLVQILGYSLLVDSVFLLLKHIYLRWIYEDNQVTKMLVDMLKWTYWGKGMKMYISYSVFSYFWKDLNH